MESEWIKVSDRFPENDARYLVKVTPCTIWHAPQPNNFLQPYLENGVNIAYFKKEKEEWVYSDFQNRSYMHTVTHWMPLPKTPED